MCGHILMYRSFPSSHIVIYSCRCIRKDILSVTGIYRKFTNVKFV